MNRSPSMQLLELISIALLSAPEAARDGGHPGAGQAGGSTRRGAACLAVSEGTIAVGGQGGVDLYLDGKRIGLGEKRNVLALAFSGDRLIEGGGTAAVEGRVWAWDFRRGKLLWFTRPHEDLTHAVVASRGKVYSGGADRSIAVLDLETGAVEGRLEGHSGAVLALAVSPDGALLASGGADRSLRVWDTAGRKLIRTIQSHSETVHALAWSSDGALLASGSADRTVRFFEPAIGRLVRIARGHEGAVLSLAWMGGRLCSGCADGKVRIIDAGDGSVVETREAHSDWVTALAALPGGLVSADWTGKVLLWKEGKPVELR